MNYSDLEMHDSAELGPAFQQLGQIRAKMRFAMRSLFRWYICNHQAILITLFPSGINITMNNSDVEMYYMV